MNDVNRFQVGNLQYKTMNITDQEPTQASMSEVVMLKKDLIEALIANKAKHDVILETAIAGYWETALAKLNRRKARFAAQVNDFIAEANQEFERIEAKIANKEELPQHLSLRAINVDAALGLVYPEDHSKDYERALRMMQSSIFETVRLSADEYDAYVLNNWEWKKNFLATNTAYVNVMREKKDVRASLLGAQVHGYKEASDEAVRRVTESGCTAF